MPPYLHAKRCQVGTTWAKREVAREGVVLALLCPRLACGWDGRRRGGGEGIPGRRAGWPSCGSSLHPDERRWKRREGEQGRGRAGPPPPQLLYREKSTRGVAARAEEQEREVLALLCPRLTRGREGAWKGGGHAGRRQTC